MPSVEIVAVGTELLLGHLVDTNTSFIAQELAAAGIDVRASGAVGDNRERIAAAIRASLSRADGVVTTGGLGPTTDDLTKEAVCDALGLGVELIRAGAGADGGIIRTRRPADAREQSQTGRASARQRAAAQSQRDGAGIHRVLAR